MMRECGEMMDTELTPYDDGYPIHLLQKSIKNRLYQAQKIASDIYSGVIKESGLVAEASKTLNKETKYVVDMSDELIKAITRGEIKLAETKEGKLCAQLVNNNGKFGSKLGIKREDYICEMDPAKVSDALQMAALQTQIEKMSEQIVSIDQNVKDVLQGQQNDRIGLYYSGLSLYIEAQNVVDENLKKALLVQALRSLAESTFQLSLNMKSDIKYLIDKEYNSEKGKKVKLIDKKMSSINKGFEFVHQASILRAAIYCEQGEIKAMMKVLSEYSKYISTTIANNANLLSQLDVEDKGGMEGLWSSRAKLSLDISELQDKLINKDKIFWIEKEGE